MQIHQQKVRQTRQQPSAIRYPRIALPLALILAIPAGLIVQANTHPDGMSLISTNPLLAYTLICVLVLSGLLYISALLWLLVVAIGRGQKGWAWSFFFTAGIAILLYLILDPQE